MDFSRKDKVFVTCARGVQEVLAGELRALGYKPESEAAAGVLLAGSLADCMRLNLHLRTAHRVLFQLDRFSAANADEVYARLSGLPWEDVIPEDGYVSVVASVDNPTIRDSRFAALRVKDAVVDRIAGRRGRRPDSGPDRTGCVLSLHWKGRQATLSLDTSGEPLSMRGYRMMPHKAPMRETLAAACLIQAGYTGKGALVNPMCGSGTLAIEAALMSTGTAPGLLRRGFAFRHVIGHDEAAWSAMRAEARGAMRMGTGARIVATDIDPEAVAAARENAAEAGMDAHIEFGVCDFRQTPVPEPVRRHTNVVAVNPEYGKRLGDEVELEGVYKALGDFFKQSCGGYRAGLFTGNLKLAKRVGLRAHRRVVLMNGPIECRLLLYELYEGSRK